jgi:hypothetical protein
MIFSGAVLNVTHGKQYNLDGRFNLKRIFFPILLTFLFSSPALAKNPKNKVLGVYYFKKIFGHIHQNPSSYSTTLTTLSCGHPVRLLSKKTGGNSQKVLFNRKWNLIKVGPYTGYIQQSFLSKKKVKCFQDRYPKFFDSLNLEITDMYYWGRLQDQYVRGKSQRPGK